MPNPFALGKPATFHKLSGIEVVEVRRNPVVVDGGVHDEYDHALILNLQRKNLSLEAFMLSQDQAAQLFDLLGEFMDGDPIVWEEDPNA